VQGLLRSLGTFLPRLDISSLCTPRVIERFPDLAFELVQVRTRSDRDGLGGADRPQGSSRIAQIEGAWRMDSIREKSIQESDPVLPFS